MEDHVAQPARLGLPVVISESWYKAALLPTNVSAFLMAANAKPGEGGGCAVSALSSILFQILEGAAVDPVADQDLPLS